MSPQLKGQLTKINKEIEKQRPIKLIVTINNGSLKLTII